LQGAPAAGSCYNVSFAVEGGVLQSVIAAALRAVSYLFHLALGVTLVGMAALALMGPEVTFTVGILPWQGRTLAWILLAAGVLAIAAVYLALRRVLPILLVLWSAAVLIVLAHGCFLSRYYFGRDGPATALLLVLGAAAATLGGWLSFRRKERWGSAMRDRFEAT